MDRLTAGAGALAVLLLAACGGTTGAGGAAGTVDTSAAGTGAATTGTVGTGTGTTRRAPPHHRHRQVSYGGRTVAPGRRPAGKRPLRGTVTFTAAGERTVASRSAAQAPSQSPWRQAPTAFPVIRPRSWR